MSDNKSPQLDWAGRFRGKVVFMKIDRSPSSKAAGVRLGVEVNEEKVSGKWEVMREGPHVVFGTLYSLKKDGSPNQVVHDMLCEAFADQWDGRDYQFFNMVPEGDPIVVCVKVTQFEKRFTIDWVSHHTDPKPKSKDGASKAPVKPADVRDLNAAFNVPF